ncbi:MAG: PRC-barrel domain-containing protein [Pedobacter sp.]
MKVYFTQLIDYSLGALDGEIGKIKDVYFDDHDWIVRYFVAQTGNWLFKREVLISPVAVEQSIEITNDVLNVNLSKDQVKNSPAIDTELPVSVQQESSLFDHYSWPSFGRAGTGWPTAGMVRGTTAVINKAELPEEFDPHLRSFLHVSQYEVLNETGRVGLVKDLLIDLENWSIPFLLIDDIFTSDKERVMIPTEKIVSIDWDTFQVKISSNQDEIQNAPRINAEGFFLNDSNKLFPSK